MRLRLFFLFCGCTTGFVTLSPSPASLARVARTRHVVVASQLQETVDEYKTAVASNVKTAVENEDPGYQLLVVGQAILLLFLVIGDIPLLGDGIAFVSGPGLMVAGASLALAGVVELGPNNLTPFATPVKDNELKTNGVYAISRHPMYAGLLLGGLGLGVATNSFERVIIAAILYVFLDYKATIEENQLKNIHPAYEAYQSTVPKLVPDLASFFENVDDDDDDYEGDSVVASATASFMAPKDEDDGDLDTLLGLDDMDDDEDDEED